MYHTVREATQKVLYAHEKARLPVVVVPEPDVPFAPLAKELQAFFDANPYIRSALVYDRNGALLGQIPFFAPKMAVQAEGASYQVLNCPGDHPVYAHPQVEVLRCPRHGRTVR